MASGIRHPGSSDLDRGPFSYSLLSFEEGHVEGQRWKVERLNYTSKYVIISFKHN